MLFKLPYLNLWFDMSVHVFCCWHYLLFDLPAKHSLTFLRYSRNVKYSEFSSSVLTSTSLKLTSISVLSCVLILISDSCISSRWSSEETYPLSEPEMIGVGAIVSLRHGSELFIIKPKRNKHHQYYRLWFIDQSMSWFNSNKNDELKIQKLENLTKLLLETIETIWLDKLSHDLIRITQNSNTKHTHLTLK